METNTIEKISATLEKLKTLESNLGICETRIKDYEIQTEALLEKQKLILAAKSFFAKAVDIMYSSSVKELEDLINEVVGAVFYDRDFQIKMELTDSRQKSLIWYLKDNDHGVEMSIKNGVGRGVKTVLSFIIQSYYLLSFGSTYLFVDEGYSYISEAYVGKFFEFVKLLCKEKGLCLVMISHDDRFKEYADRTYTIMEGNVLTNEN